MTSLFVNLFKKTDLDEQLAFQKAVLGVLKETYPDKPFSISNDPLSLDLGGAAIGLTNVRASFLLTPQTDKDLIETVEAHFGKLFDGVDIKGHAQSGWNDISGNVMPQLMPEKFLDKLELVSCPFGGGVVLGFVVDSEQAYSYVSKSDIERWGVTTSELRDNAVRNLDNRSDHIEAVGVPGPQGLFVINSMDGFDAVRIISELTRGHCTETIGAPFYFGVPNRDFLICWSHNDDRQFQDGLKSQISRDFNEQPYPLSPSVFSVSAEGDIREAENEPPDPRVLTADNN